MAAPSDDFMSFVFGGNTGLSYDTLQRRRAIAQAMAARRQGVKDLPSGMTYFGEALGQRIQDERMAAAEAEAEKKHEADMAKLSGAGGSVSGGAAAMPPPVTQQPPPVRQPPPVTQQPTMTTPTVTPATTRPADPAVDPAMLDPAAMDPRNRVSAAVVAQQQQAQHQPSDVRTPEVVAQPNPTMPGALPPVQTSLAQQVSPTSTSLGGVPDDLRMRRRAAVGGIESGGRGDPYRTVVDAGRGRFVYGKYGIMDRNIGPWTQEALGRAMTPQEFLANDKAQDDTFDHRMNAYANRYGEEGAARAWYAGERGMRNLAATDRFGRLNVAQYGQDYLRRLGGDGSAPIRVASLGRPDVTPIPFKEENEPTPTDIRRMPTQIAANTFAPVSGPLMPERTVSPASDSTRAAAPGPALAEAYVMPKPVAPTPPPRIPESDRERAASQILLSSQNPRTRQAAEFVLKQEQDRRKYDQDRLVTKYNADVQHFEQQMAKWQEQVATKDKRTLELREARDKDTARQTFGSMPEFAIKGMEKSRDSANAAVGSLEAIQNAENAMAAGTLFGLGANAKLLAYRAKALATGDADAKRIVAATETFKTSLGPQIMQAVRAYGGAQISNADREFAEKMSAGDITLDEESARRMLDIGRRAARGLVEDHNRLFESVTKNQPAAVRDLFRARDPVAPSPPPMSGAPKPASDGRLEFATEADAAKAGLKPGTKIKINGRNATWD